MNVNDSVCDEGKDDMFGKDDICASERIKKCYRLFESFIVCCVWISSTIAMCIIFGWKVNKNPMGPTTNFIYAGFTRASRAFVSAYTAPFITNVIRDYKCIVWDDYWTSIMIVSIVKIFGIV
jgi:predicted small integral membrane protein